MAGRRGPLPIAPPSHTAKDGATRSPTPKATAARNLIRAACLAAALLGGGAGSAPARAELVGVEIASRSDLLGGAVYGDVGAYEKLAGRMHFAVDPRNAANRGITDIDYAPTNADGRVELSADFYLIRPKNSKKANGTLLFEVANRGRKGLFSMFDHGTGSADPSKAADVGEGFLLERGYTLLWVGWQFDVPEAQGLMRAVVPRATDHGRPIEGLVRSDFVVSAPARDHSLGDRGHLAYAVADLDDPASTMTVRDTPLGPRRVIPREDWRFARVDAGRVVEDARSVYLEEGFEPFKIYEVVYSSQNPAVAGLGLAAIRDAVSALEHDGADELGLPRGTVRRSIGFGLSQSGRLLRTFLYDGFNADERQRRVFDGVIAHLAGGARGSFNVRFAQPSRASWSYFYPNELFPFSDEPQTDPVTGISAGLLGHLAAELRPKIFYTNSSNEYWRGSAALTHVSVDGERDLALPSNVRLYLFSGTQHVPAGAPPRKGLGRALPNPNDYRWFLRALLEDMNAWIEHGDAPPESRYPTLRDGSLVTPAALRFPALPDTLVPRQLRAPLRLDYGATFRKEGIATKEPPEVGAAYPLLLPQVDADGNEIAGLRSPEQAVPLATYTGWNLYDPADGPGDRLVDLLGSYIPFAATADSRRATNDPRPSAAERYPTRERYLALVEDQAKKLVAGRYLLARDVTEIVRRAGDRWDRLESPRD
jgi:hypothetical protein